MLEAVETTGIASVVGVSALSVSSGALVICVLVRVPPLFQIIRTRMRRKWHCLICPSGVENVRSHSTRKKYLWSADNSKIGQSVSGVALAAFAGSLAFFFFSNLAVWLSSGLYPLTLAGFSECFIAAIPFYTNTLLGDLFYTSLLFFGFMKAESRFAWLRVRPLQTA